MINSDKKRLPAVVILDMNYKEYDKLFTLFTRDLGKIKAYAFGVRREHSKKIGALRLFSFCEVELKGKDGKYNICDANLIDSFDSLSSDYETMCYASYFSELIDYFSFENIESRDVFNLLYYTYKALSRNVIDKELIKLIFELKLLKYQGEYIDGSMLNTDNGTLIYTWDYVINSSVEKLYTFKLKDEIFKLFRNEVEKEFKDKIGIRFKSLDKITL